MSNNLYKNYLTTHPFYSSKSLILDGSFRFFAKNYLMFLPSSSSAKILDIGCGSGHFLAYLKNKNYKNFFGVDISSEQVEYCKKYITKNVETISNIDTYLKANKNSFDFILMNDVIEHLEKGNIVGTLSLILASLKKDGKVLIRTVNLKNRWGTAVRYMDFTHTTGFTQESLRQVLLMAGFEHVLLREEIHPVHDIKSFVRVVLKKLFEYIYHLEYIASFGAFNPMLSNMLIGVGVKKN